MSLIERVMQNLKSHFRKGSHHGLGLLVFENTSEVIRAERILKKEGCAVSVKGPPPELRKGCDLVIEFQLVEELRISRVLQKQGAPALDVVPLNSELLQPVDIFQTRDFGDYLMVRAANMKITVDKRSTMIVNISGGGCPDVPYLAQEMVGKMLKEAPAPGDIGHTLYGYALQLAYEEIQQQC
jgi:putative Se/S carrier protein